MLTSLIVSTIISLQNILPKPSDFYQKPNKERIDKSPVKLQDLKEQFEVFKEGLASWYGTEEHGRLTASGKRFNMYEMTAAFPEGRGVRKHFGKKFRVTNLRNHKHVVVTITDTGGFARYHRIIDLSYAAAKELDMIDSGLAKVRIERVVRRNKS